MKTGKRISKKSILIFLLILIALTLYTFLFFTKKKDYHGDEVWSYGLANSYFNPFLHNSGTWDDNSNPDFIQNYETWITGETFHNYLTVQQNERFAYDSVWYNQSADVHPPFYYAIIHTLCSFFPDRFSPIFALLINYIAFSIVIIILYKTGTKWGSFLYAFLLCTFYAFSAGAEDTFTFLRMYALCAAFAMLLFNQMEHYIENNQKKTLFSLFIITLLSCLTHYYLIVFAFFLTAVTELYLLIKKKWKSFFSLGCTMLFSVLLSVLIFPSMLQHLLFRGSNFSDLIVSFSFQAKLIASLIMQQFLGFSFPSYKTMLPVYLGSVLLFALILLLLSFFLFRNEHLASRFMRKSIKIVKNIGQKITHLFVKLPVSHRILSLTLLCIYLFYIKNLPVASMKTASIRYFFPFYPLLCLCLSLPLKEILTRYIPGKKNKILFSVCILAICTLGSNIMASHCFFFTNDEHFGKQIEELNPDAYYIITTSIPHAINNFSVSLQDKANVYAICEKDYKRNELPQSLQTLPNDDSVKPVYLLLTDTEISQDEKVNEAEKEKWMSMFSKLPYVKDNTFIGQDTVNGYKILIYQLR